MSDVHLHVRVRPRDRRWVALASHLLLAQHALERRPAALQPDADQLAAVLARQGLHQGKR